MLERAIWRCGKVQHPAAGSAPIVVAMFSPLTLKRPPAFRIVILGL